MARVHQHENLIYSPGTQVVALVEVQSPSRTLHPHGAVGVIAQSPSDQRHAYRVRFADGYEASLAHDEIVPLAKYKEDAIFGGTGGSPTSAEAASELTSIDANLRGSTGGRATSATNLLERVIFRCVIGSRVYGLDDERSDTDRRGIYLPPAELQWSLYGVPEQLENEATQEAYWELQKFLILALKANPNVLECLYTPLVEHATPLAQELLAMREAFLSRLVYQTYNGYVASQFKKMQADLRNHGRVKWKHVMHLIRLLLSGIVVLREGHVPVRVDAYREDLLAIKRGERSWDDVEAWRKSLHHEFDAASQATKLPERPNYERA